MQSHHQKSLKKNKKIQEYKKNQNNNFLIDKPNVINPTTPNTPKVIALIDISDFLLLLNNLYIFALFLLFFFLCLSLLS
jgi:hypothetical protein